MAKKPVVVWAIDPFEKEAPTSRSVVKKLTEWARTADFDIQPVHVLRVPEFLPANIVEEGVTGYLEKVEAVAGDFLKKLGIETNLRTKIVVEPSSSSRDAVQKFCEYAAEQEAKWIVVSTHGRSGLNRIVFGSFAENLLAQSYCPVFFLSNPQQIQSAQEGDQFRRVLFPTDFSDYSKKAFAEFLNYVKQFKLEVTLYYSVCLPSGALSVGSGAPLVIPEDYFPEQIAYGKEEGARWVADAEKSGVEVKFLIRDEGYNSNVGDLVLGAAKESKADVIAMASVSGALKAFVAGSVARSVFRTRQFPVLVYGPHSLEKIKS